MILTLASPVVLGLDLSLTATGVAGNAGGGWTALIKPAAKLRGHQRIAHIKRTILDQYAEGVDLVVVEGPSYGSVTGSFHERAGLWWLITHALWGCERQVVVMPPASLKKYATGKGNADKDRMLLEVARRFTWFDGDNNEADALMLAAAGADWAGSPMVSMPAANRSALAGLGWPALQEAS